MKLKNLILNSLKNIDLKMIEIKEPSKKFLDLIENEVKIQRKKNFLYPVPKIKKEHLANFVFLLRTLDFRRWEFKKNWEYKNKKRFWSLFARLEDLFNLGIEKIDFENFKKIISPKELEYLARIRYKFFKKNLLWLNKNHKGDFRNYFESRKNPVDFVLDLTKLERFQDFIKKPKKIYFLKPNQLLYAEYIIATNNVEKYYKKLSDLTVFADYRLPQLLTHFNIIIPNKILLEKIKLQKIIKCNSMEEINIRIATILACESIRKKIKDISSFEIDMALWNLSYKIKNKINIPHFKSKSIFY